ncbi:hypothetical protein KKA08_06860 [bacterium]|nr:hypothetical protein [bacterium]
MIRNLSLAALLVIVAFSLQVQAGDKPIQISLVNPIQIFPDTDSVTGVRLNLIYGKNADLTGIDVGIANHLTGSMGGIQWGLVGIVDGDFVGWQDNWINLTKGKFQGLQTGLYSSV